MRIGVVGATGLVGGQLLRTLEERGLPTEELRAFASARSAGRAVSFRGVEVLVEEATSASYAGLDVVLMSAGATLSRQLAPVIAAQGPLVIDNSSAWRTDPEVPLVVAEVNPGAATTAPKGIIANPNCTTMVCMPVVAPLHAEAGLQRIVASTYQAVSGAGVEAVAELAGQVAAAGEKARELAWAGDSVDLGLPRVFPQPIAFNVVAHAGSFVDDETDEEKKFRNESRRILGLPDLDVTCTCVRVPVFTGHSVSLLLETAADLSPERALELLGTAPGVELAQV
ncbi:MAG TPA: aspartate-semialdehyde dehydrogenase, partial [Acidimicrobiales bacterium]|nr:aspartate-semialdehyde dehydrogenase [Acidimicrobiales bacterium]